ncbi:hypothetical protein D9603_13750 [Pseudoalteromonas sp. PS5]|nr:hypothetical protein D9603_13750 [Pseudoalteromonas sp. PS5]
MKMKSNTLSSLALATLAAFIGGCKLTSPPSEPSRHDEVLTRKNIDALTDNELKAYEHAIARMKKKSRDNIYDPQGFLWQAWVHNCPTVWQPKNQGVVPLAALSTQQDWIGNSNEFLQYCDFRPLLKSKLGLGDDDFVKVHPGQCEHAKDTFLHWHRAEFYFFEKALQNADPEGKFGPSTKNVTVPFWNFTKAPTGQRYPKAFENTHSPLYSIHRNMKPALSPSNNRRSSTVSDPNFCGFNRSDSTTDKPLSCGYTSPYLLAYQIHFNNWREFGGSPYNRAGNFGAFEAQIHNPMHAIYAGCEGQSNRPVCFMEDNSQAGFDPVFYSFHAFIDFAYGQWLQTNAAKCVNNNEYCVTGGRMFMRGTQSDSLPVPQGFSEGKTKPVEGRFANMGRAELYFDSEKVGYNYADPSKEFIDGEVIAQLIKKHRDAGFDFYLQDGTTRQSIDTTASLFSELLSYGAHAPASRVTESQIKTSKLILPEANFTTINTAQLKIVRKPMDIEDYSFQADIYLVPASVKVTPEVIKNDDFRASHLAVSTAYWALGDHSAHDGHGGHSEHMSKASSVSLDQELVHLIGAILRGKNKAKPWQLVLVVSGHEAATADHFEPLKIEFK